ncbi:MAG: hypothetical protein JWL64_1585 [Frankiales bacterium]|nr:hypothetical protein [Frankiales bacterium]
MSEFEQGPDQGPEAGSPASPPRVDRAPADRTPPRSPELDGLLRELDQLRRTLETDLSLAAAAVEEGSFEIAAQVLSHDQEVLRAFSGQATDRLRASPPPPRRHPRAHPSGVRRLFATAAGPAGLTAAAAALVVAALITAGPSTNPPAPSQTASGPGTPETLRASLTSLTKPYQALVELSDERAPDHQVRAAAVRLNAGVRDASEQFKTDPITASAALGILQAERQVLSARDTAGTMTDLIVNNQQLTQEIQASLPVAAPTPAPTPSPTVDVVTSAPPETVQPPAPTEPTVTTTPPATDPVPTPTPVETPAPEVQPTEPSDLLHVLADITQGGTPPPSSPGQP